MRLAVQPVDVAAAVEAAIDSSRPAIEARGIRSVARLDPNLESINGDPARVQQIVWNLLSNAVKFTPQGGLIEIALAQVGSNVEISVKDSGKGIDPGFLSYIFDPFRQEQSGTTRTRGGLGLGLAITRQLVELHGGTIEARSEGEGRGATFIVRLPVASARRPSSSPPSTEARQIRLNASFERPPQLEGMSILVVDDEPDARELMQSLLGSCGSRVTTASGVEEAMQALTREHFDVLISDIGMPGQDGYDLIRQVRALPADHGGTMPAAALTAYARAEDRKRVLGAGYSMHVSKPIEPAELVSVIVSLTRFAPQAVHAEAQRPNG
jgi:CheY-like chemotaxis protein/anti-sigma regulatory factor (Ser/Thr protein kinase)